MRVMDCSSLSSFRNCFFKSSTLRGTFTHLLLYLDEVKIYGFYIVPYLLEKNTTKYAGWEGEVSVLLHFNVIYKFLYLWFCFQIPLIVENVFIPQICNFPLILKDFLYLMFVFSVKIVKNTARKVNLTRNFEISDVFVVAF